MMATWRLTMVSASVKTRLRAPHEFRMVCATAETKDYWKRGGGDGDGEMFRGATSRRSRRAMHGMLDKFIDEQAPATPRMTTQLPQCRTTIGIVVVQTIKHLQAERRAAALLSNRAHQLTWIIRFVDHRAFYQKERRLEPPMKHPDRIRQRRRNTRTGARSRTRCRKTGQLTDSPIEDYEPV